MQILVTVATIQMRALKTEVEQGSVGTVVGHGLVGPKRWGSPVSRFLGFLSFGSFTPVHRKGTRLRFLDRHTPIYFIFFSGNASKLGDAAECPGKSFLFFLTSTFFDCAQIPSVHDWRLCVDTILCGMELLSGPGISLAGDWAGSSAEHHATFFVCGVRRAFGGP